MNEPAARAHVHFVTGRLAEHALRAVVEPLAREAGFTWTVDVLPITVAALMTPAWIAKRMHVPPQATRVVIPGYCDADLTPLEETCRVPVERGPRDLADLPEFFGRQSEARRNYGAYDIQILAEINHAPRLTHDEILAMARHCAASGADLIDVGCEPGDAWAGVADCVKLLRDEGFRVSIDSLNPAEIAPAVRAGAELVLSVNKTNRRAALDWNCEVVVVPDDFATLGGLDETVELLASEGVRLRIDPVLEPIGFNFFASLARYRTVRERYPDAEMMMGIGNLTELTDVDSAGVNVLLLAMCQELGVRSVLTTEVINWARSSVRECDLGRRLSYFAVKNRRLPKHIEPQLVMLRDSKLHQRGDDMLVRLAAEIKDNNYRIFAESGLMHIVSAGLHLKDSDPFRLMEKLLATGPKNIDAAHAFYLGYELCKAQTALTLGKNYEQDEALDWGFLTVEEKSHRLARGKPSGNTGDEEPRDE
jgi:dihydropteroate synthase